MSKLTTIDYLLQMMEKEKKKKEEEMQKEKYIYSLQTH